MRKLLFSSAAILLFGLAVPAGAQQPSSTQPQQSGSHQPTATQTQQGGMQEQNLSKDEIRQVQEALDKKGFKAGQADGVLGAETKNAIKEFQQKEGFNATGELDSQTMSALGVSTTGQTGGQRPSTGEQRPSNTGGSNAR